MNFSHTVSKKMERGMTLIEALLVVGLTTVLVGAILSVVRDFYVGNQYVLESAISIDSARRGIATALENLREASYGDDGSYPVASAATSTVMFYSDVDGDNAIERVQILIQNGVLYRVITNSAGNPPSYVGQTSATSTIISYVRNDSSTPLFTYYDSSGAQLPATNTDVSKISAVSATLLIDVNPSRAPNVLTFTGTATLRNLRAP